MNRSTAPKAAIVGTLLMLAGIAGVLAYQLGPKLYWMKSEYVTAGVISAADRYVAEHPQQWPSSWQDLGEGDQSRYTEFRFDLTTDRILQNRELIYTAIQPRSRKYRTYPHARRQLDELYRKLAEEPRPNEPTAQ
jgi:hypothetical protein